MTHNEPEDTVNLPSELMNDDLETTEQTDKDESSPTGNIDDTDTVDEILNLSGSEEEEQSNSEIILEASRRIYIFDWISNNFIGKSIRRAKFFALSFVGSGFKTLAFMLVLTFWSVFWYLLCELARLLNQPAL